MQLVANLWLIWIYRVNGFAFIAVTVGDFYNNIVNKKGSPQSSVDPFARDPFKVQSYNFRYAERPHMLPTQGLGSPVSNHSTQKPFETYYYNPDFVANRNAKENAPTNKFQENRRRKYVCEQRAPNSTATFYNGNRSSTGFGNQYGVRSGSCLGRISSQHINLENASPYLKRGCTREFELQLHGAVTSRPVTPFANQRQPHKGESHTSLTSRRSSTTTQGPRLQTSCFEEGQRQLRERDRQQASRPSTPIDNTRSARPKVGPYSSQQNTSANHETKIFVTPRVKPSPRSCSTPRVKLSPSSCSGCQININIKGLDDSQIRENVTINVTDHQLDNPVRCNVANSAADIASERVTSPNCKNFNVGGKVSTETFVVNKCLSKFSVLGDQYREEPRGQQPQRKAPLRPTAVVYDLQAAAARKSPNTEHMPSLVAWNSSTRLSPNYNTNYNSRVQSSAPARGSATNSTQWKTPSQNNQTTDASRPLNSCGITNAVEHLRRIYHESRTNHRNLRTTQNSLSPKNAGSSTAASEGRMSEGTKNTQNLPQVGTRFWHARYSARNPQVNTSNRAASQTSLRESSSKTDNQTARKLVWTNSRRRAQSPVNVNINVYAD